jgi:hypothetical protein
VPLEEVKIIAEGGAFNSRRDNDRVERKRPTDSAAGEEAINEPKQQNESDETDLPNKYETDNP